MGVWNKGDAHPRSPLSPLFFSPLYNISRPTDQLKMLSGFFSSSHIPHLVFVSLLLYLYVAVHPSPFPPTPLPSRIPPPKLTLECPFTIVSLIPRFTLPPSSNYSFFRFPASHPFFFFSRNPSTPDIKTSKTVETQTPNLLV